ncbi:MAG: hypothetical protein ACSHYA_01735 [Opitutaceae bacterium]
MLSLRSPIAASDIYTIEALAPGHPVYRLDGFGDGTGRIDSIVVKLEGNADPRNVKAAAALMTVVDPKARTVVLSAQEIQSLRIWAGGGAVPSTDAFRTATKLQNDLTQTGAWVKMDVKRLKTLQDAVMRRIDPANPDKADVRVIANALKNSGGLEKLGEIIAADLFNGNTDRFAPPSAVGPAFGTTMGPGGVRLEVISNVGNVFVYCNGNGSGKPIGLDNYDPSSEWKDLNNAAIDANRWGGILLLDSKKPEREEYARSIISDLEGLLGPRNRSYRFLPQNRLGTGRKRRLRHGMESGAKKLRRFLQNWQRANPHHQHKPAIAAKMALLQW